MCRAPNRAPAMPATASTDGPRKVDSVRHELNGTAEHQNGAAEPHLDAIAYLRHLQASTLNFIPLSTAATTVGVTLISIGACWAALHFLRAHPYLLVIATGLVCLIVGVAADPDGLLIKADPEVQKSLLEVSIFDLLHDYAPTTNFTRKWGRVFMLCSATSEDTIAAITRGMDPEFVHMIFKTKLIEFLPLGVSRVLLPEHKELIPLEDADREADEDKDARSTSAMGKWCHAPLAVEVANRVRMEAKRCQSAASKPKLDNLAPEIEPLTPAHIGRMIAERKEEVESKIVEPSLDALVASLCNFRTLKRSVLKALQAGAALATAYWWGVTAALVTSPSAQMFFLRGLHLLAFTRGRSRDSLIRHARRATSMLGVLSAGFGLALLFYSRRMLPPPPPRPRGPN